MTARSPVSRFFFGSAPVLESLPGTDLQLLQERLKLKKIKKGRDILIEGSYPRYVYILKRGKVKLYQRSSSGVEQLIYIYTPGDMFGFRPLLSNEKNPASAQALEDCTIYYLPAKYFLSILKKSASLSNVLLQNLSHEFTVWVNRIAAFSQKSVKERLALSLLILREKYRKPDGRYAEITLSRADLASFIGTTNETLSRILARFNSERLIRFQGRKIIVINTPELHSLTE